MKTIRTFLALAIIISILVLPACTPSYKKGEFYIDKNSASDSVMGISWDLAASFGDFFNDEFVKFEDLLGTTATVSLNGETYEGTYKDSTNNFIFSYELLHNYFGKGCHFSIFKNSGKLAYFTKRLDENTEDPIEESRAKEIAEEFLKNEVDIENFVYEGASETITEKGALTLTYIRKIDGIETAERAMISVDATGDIYSYHAIDIGLFADYTLPKDFDKAKVEELARNIVLDILKNRDVNMDDYTVIVRSGTLIMKEGQCFYSLDIAVRNTSKNMGEALNMFYAID